MRPRVQKAEIFAICLDDTGGGVVDNHTSFTFLGQHMSTHNPLVTVLKCVVAVTLLVAPTALALKVNAIATATLTTGYDCGSYGDNLSTPQGSTLDCGYEGLASICNVWGGGYTVAHDTVNWNSGAFDARIEIKGKITGSDTPYWETCFDTPGAYLEVNAGDDDWCAENYEAASRHIACVWGDVNYVDGYEIRAANGKDAGSYMWFQSVGGDMRSFPGYSWKEGRHLHEIQTSRLVTWRTGDEISINYQSSCHLRLLSAEDTEGTSAFCSQGGWNVYLAAWDNLILQIEYWQLN